MRFCKRCQLDKPISSFLVSKKEEEPYGFCKDCRIADNLKNKAKRQQHYLDNKEKVIAKTKVYVENNREKVKQRKRNYREKNRERLILEGRLRYDNTPKDVLAEKELIKNYGITLEDKNKMFSDQENCCAICGSETSKSKRAFCVDHCHTTGLIRGILCNSCNRGLGFFEDSIDSLESAIKYLNKHNKGNNGKLLTTD